MQFTRNATSPKSIYLIVSGHFHNIRLACERNFANSFTDLEEESTPILFPMAVAYCVVAGCIMGIMWENVGKNYAIEHREESQEEHDKQLEFKLVKEKILKKNTTDKNYFQRAICQFEQRLHLKFVYP